MDFASTAMVSARKLMRFDEKLVKTDLNREKGPSLGNIGKMEKYFKIFNSTGQRQGKQKKDTFTTHNEIELSICSSHSI